MSRFQNVSVSSAGLNRTETIAAPMRNAVTIPIYVNEHELIVYVCRGAFTTQLTNEGRFVKEVAVAIADAIARMNDE